MMRTLEELFAEHLMKQDYGPEWRTVEPVPLIAHVEEARELAAVVSEWMTSDDAVQGVAQTLTEHAYSDTHIGRCHCGIKTDNMQTHQAAAALSAHVKNEPE